MTELVLKNGGTAVATLRKPEVLADLSSTYSSDKLLVLKLDVTKPQEIISAFSKAVETFGRIDVVFNNAGMGVLGEVEATGDDAARALFDLNFWGATNVSKEAVRIFRDVNKPIGGRLLQVSSMVGIEGRPGLGYYSATKFALEGISESLAAELDPEWNIKITVVEPGGFRTEGLSSMVTIAPHPAYVKPTLHSVMVRQHLKSNQQLVGNVTKGVEKIYKLTELADPPLHFPLGKDAIGVAKKKTARLAEETDKYSSWSEGLDTV